MSADRRLYNSLKDDYIKECLEKEDIITNLILLKREN